MKNWIEEFTHSFMEKHHVKASVVFKETDSADDSTMAAYHPWKNSFTVHSDAILVKVAHMLPSEHQDHFQSVLEIFLSSILAHEFGHYFDKEVKERMNFISYCLEKAKENPEKKTLWMKAYYETLYECEKVAVDLGRSFVNPKDLDFYLDFNRAYLNDIEKETKSVS